MYACSDRRYSWNKAGQARFRRSLIKNKIKGFSNATGFLDVYFLMVAMTASTLVLVYTDLEYAGNPPEP